MLWKRLFPLVFAFGLFGCTTKLIYSNLDWIVIDHIEDYVSLTSDQEDIIELSVQKLSDWHRTEELPRYIEHLNELEKMNPETVDADYIHAQIEKFRQHAERIITKASPNIYALVSQLDQEQIDELMENTAKENKEFREENNDKTEEERRETYQERMEENLEDWIGKLTKEQKAIIKDWSQDIKITYFDWAKHDEVMFDQLNTLFKRRDEASYFQSTFFRIFDDPESFYTEELKQKLEFNRQLASERIAKVINLMNDKQKAHFKEEVNDWRSIAQDLAKSD